jgi:hypothetical protein
MSDHHHGAAAQQFGQVPASRRELLALLETLRAFFSESAGSDVQVQVMGGHLLDIIERALASRQQAPIAFDLTREELFVLTIAAGTMTAPYRAGAPVSREEACLYATLSPFVERLLALVQQIHSREVQAVHPSLNDGPDEW